MKQHPMIGCPLASDGIRIAVVSGGTGFWHETYCMRGGIEAIYDDVPKPVGMMAFAPVKDARGPMFSSSARVGRGPSQVAPVVSESDLYDR